MAPASDARAALLKRLIDLGEAAARQGASSSASEGGARLLTYASRARERVALVALESPWVVLALEGHKRVDVAGASHIMRAGETLLVPRGATISVVNVPDARTGIYRAIGVEVLGVAHALVQRHHPDLVKEPASWLAGRLRPVPAGPTALQAFAHFCETMLSPDAHPRVLHHALEGLLLALLVEEEVPPEATARARAAGDLVRAVRTLLREEPDRAWSVDAVARHLGVSSATLRRRLARDGTSMRALLLEERLSLARVLLGDGRASVADVALRCGYASPGKFARQFVRKFGTTPSAFVHQRP